MDDIWLFGSNAGRLLRAQLELQDAMRSIGLSMNAGKTDLLEGEAAERDIEEREHGAVNELIGRMLASPEKARRATLKFVSIRLRRARIFDRVDEIAAAANRMPHLADVLARLFRDSGKWRDLQDWYVEYAGSERGRIEWSFAQLERCSRARSHRHRFSPSYVTCSGRIPRSR
jgi:hypothetical protein